MAKNIQIKDVIIQYAFINNVNPVSHKFSFDCLIPQDHPQVQEVIDACMGAWAPVSNGMDAARAQSLGYRWVQPANPADQGKFAADVLPLLDMTKNYLIFKGVQDGNTTTPIGLFDSASTPITNRNLVGNGTRANVSLTAFGYNTSGQRGVKLYGQWLQIISLVENPYANMNAGPAPIEGGYIADAAYTATIHIDSSLAAPAAVAAPVAGTYAAPVAAPAYTAPVVAPVAAPAAAPVYTAPEMAAPVYNAQVAPVATPAMPAMPVAAPTMPAMPVAAPAAMTPPPMPGAPVPPIG